MSLMERRMHRWEGSRENSGSFIGLAPVGQVGRDADSDHADSVLRGFGSISSGDLRCPCVAPNMRLKLTAPLIWGRIAFVKVTTQRRSLALLVRQHRMQFALVTCEETHDRGPVADPDVVRRSPHDGGRLPPIKA